MGWVPALELRDDVQTLLNSMGVAHSVSGANVTSAPVDKSTAKNILETIDSIHSIKSKVKLSVANVNDDTVAITIKVSDTDAVFNDFYLCIHEQQKNQAIK